MTPHVYFCHLARYFRLILTPGVLGAFINWPNSPARIYWIVTIIHLIWVSVDLAKWADGLLEKYYGYSVWNAIQNLYLRYTRNTSETAYTRPERIVRCLILDYGPSLIPLIICLVILADRASGLFFWALACINNAIVVVYLVRGANYLTNRFFGFSVWNWDAIKGWWFGTVPQSEQSVQGNEQVLDSKLETFQEN